ncbi:phospholipase A(1) DAD1, chloroplastic-like [Actinidia eriantha]|uniref:phospholipase A(1) DAD1, chloroplastic-like n=1 Tax=Actinidia eriantha TaxID=165200 RepID=UPI002587E7E7|nr:phospholipase A(1) DAD1, chloroplastic-like [Actinidia eriantha]
MRITMKSVRPRIASHKSHVTSKCCTITAKPPCRLNKKKLIATPGNWESIFLDSVDNSAQFAPVAAPVKISKRWMEYQGIRNWEGLLDPLDENLRGEIMRYGGFVEAAYQSFDFDPASPSYATCHFPKSSLLERSGLLETGYRVTKNLRATSSIRLPRWTEKAPSWVGTRSSWIGYVAVCHDKEEIARLGRRDIVVAFRGTATCLEWLENLRANLTELPSEGRGPDPGLGEPMVESGFLSLYTSGTKTNPNLQHLVREEIKKLLQCYPDEPLSLTITGHSLGAALATLAAYDIKTHFKRAPLVTVISFGGPRVGNRSFRQCLEKQGTKVLRIVNSDDVITKVPGFLVDGGDDNVAENDWIKKRVGEAQRWAYVDVGRELRLRSRDSPYLSGVNVATCHELKTYLHLVNGFVSSTCPFRATTRKMRKNYRFVEE